MRNPDRIDVVCQLLAKYWKEKYPDFRLGQLLWAIAGRDPFHIEDYDFIVGLAKRVGEEINIYNFPSYWVEPNEMLLFSSSTLNKEKMKRDEVQELT